MDLIKSDLKQLGIKHDNFFYESKIVNENLVNKAINKLKKKEFVEEGFLEPPKGEEKKNWKKTKRLIFKSTLFGDDSDRALQKDDGSWTYFANDVAYHSDKVSRKYDYLINILGADHTGYTKRITAAVSALSNNKVKLDCKVCQLVKLYKKGKPFKMSKRSGDFISVSDLLKEVNKDSIRFMMLNRSNDAELDFDFEKVKEKTKENPVYYVQYAYARINSITRTLKKKLSDKILIENKSFNPNEYEKKILRKIFEWPKIIESASYKLEPHKIPFYLYELSTLFHSYWSKGNEDKNYRFLENDKVKRLETLAFIYLTAIVIKNGMNILGVSLPKKIDTQNKLTVMEEGRLFSLLPLTSYHEVLLSVMDALRHNGYSCLDPQIEPLTIKLIANANGLLLTLRMFQEPEGHACIEEDNCIPYHTCVKGTCYPGSNINMECENRIECAENFAKSVKDKLDSGTNCKGKRLSLVDFTKEALKHNLTELDKDVLN